MSETENSEPGNLQADVSEDGEKKSSQHATDAVSNTNKTGGVFARLVHSGLPWLWVTSVIVFFDQWTKITVVQNFELYERMPVLSFFDLTLRYNPGGAFSFLSDAGGWQWWFFTIIACVVSVIFIIWMAYLNRRDRWLAIAFALVLGGALGNVYDRFTLGRVVDFLLFYYEDYAFPAFNVADSAITVGAFMMIIDMFRNPDRWNEKKQKESAQEEASTVTNQPEMPQTVSDGNDET